MNFCPDCENLLFIKLKQDESPENQLTEFCHNCGYSNKRDYSTNKCIYKNDYNNQNIFIQDKNLKYICQDPTIPHINNIECPNKQCKSVDEVNTNNVAYIKIDEEDMKYLYICCYCMNTWTNN
jgi:DNA-directed RNA polymerase subunit M/transcription elongation factor TFIIS